MGLSERQLLWRVELPMAAPAIMAGIRITTVTIIGLVTITAIVGQGGLGLYLLQGMRRRFTTMILTGAVLSIALAVVADVLLLLAQRAATPWSRARDPSGRA
jgi:osmoprotectant transport system permease protein